MQCTASIMRSIAINGNSQGAAIPGIGHGRQSIFGLQRAFRRRLFSRNTKYCMLEISEEKNEKYVSQLESVLVG